MELETFLSFGQDRVTDHLPRIIIMKLIDPNLWLITFHDKKKWVNKMAITKGDKTEWVGREVRRKDYNITWGKGDNNSDLRKKPPPEWVRKRVRPPPKSSQR